MPINAQTAAFDSYQREIRFSYRPKDSLGLGLGIEPEEAADAIDTLAFLPLWLSVIATVSGTPLYLPHLCQLSS